MTRSPSTTRPGGRSPARRPPPPGNGLKPGSPSSAETVLPPMAGCIVLVPVVPIGERSHRSGRAVAVRRAARPAGGGALDLVGVVSAAGLLAAAAIAVRSGAMGQPAAERLDGAARRLGDGALDTRSAAGAGPPEIRRLAADFNTMAGRLESLVRGHQAMMADVSHQLRTPLAALRLRLDVLGAGRGRGHRRRAGRRTGGDRAAVEAGERPARDGAGGERRVAAGAASPVDNVIRDRVAAWRPAAEERGRRH